MSSTALAEFLDAAAMNDYMFLQERFGSQPDECCDPTDVYYFSLILANACRYGGIESVTTLVECIRCTEDFQKEHTSRSGSANYASMLLDYCPWGSYFMPRSYVGWYRCTKLGHEIRKLLPKQERLKILNYLLLNCKIINLDPGELLYCAIVAEDAEITAVVRANNITLSPVIQIELFDTKNGYGWRRLCSILNCDEMYLEKFFDIVENLCMGFDKPIRCSMSFFEEQAYLYQDASLMGRALSCFNHSDLNKLKIMRDCMHKNAVEFLSVFENAGWLRRVHSLNSLIDYVKSKSNVEALAWLLDYKNRTVDLEAERAKAERKIEQELAASPDSVYMMSKLWGYKKLEDDTIHIISYKGSQTDVVIPGKIGKRRVAVIGGKALSRYKRKDEKAEIKTIKVSEGVTTLEPYAFSGLQFLESIVLPNTLTNIDAACFYNCRSLHSITIPSGVEHIGYQAFYDCGQLTKVILPEGITSIDDNAFYGCLSLESLHIPASVQHLGGTFCSGVTVLLVTAGTFAHKYCLTHNVKFQLLWSEEDEQR